MARGLREIASLTVALPRALRTPVSSEEARRVVAEWQQHRGDRFLAMLRTRIFPERTSPYRALLEWTGVRYDDLAHAVHRDGVDATLSSLHDAGVYVSLDEFKSEVPITRGSFTWHTAPGDFDAIPARSLANSSQAAVSGTTSGSGGTPRRVSYSWPFIADEAAHEQLLYDAHGPGVTNTPAVLWYPAPPGVAGIHNVLMDAKRGVPPRHWFSQLHPGKTGASLAGRLAPSVIAALARSASVPLPRPRHASLAQVDRVLSAMPPTAVLRGFASSVARVAEEAIRSGRSLTGTTLFTGGEPLTATRRQRMEASGAAVFARYVATEAGVVGGSTPYRLHADDMHVYTSRLAIIARDDSLRLTSLSTDASTVLLNTDLGDTGVLTERACDCALGALGLTTHVHDVRTMQRLTAEGMTVSLHAMARVLTAAWATVGVALESVQIQRLGHDAGPGHLRIVVDPAAGPLDEHVLLARLYRALRDSGGALALAAGVWEAAGTLTVVRDAVRSTAGAKRPLYLQVT